MTPYVLRVCGGEGSPRRAGLLDVGTLHAIWSPEKQEAQLFGNTMKALGMGALLAPILVLGACKGDLAEKLKNAATKEAQTSYCEGLCDWAVGCHAEARTVDEAALMTACLDATHALDSDCAIAEGEGLDATKSLAVAECTDAIDKKITDGECNSFTGSEDQIKTGTPPTTCATLGLDAQATYDGARDATQENGDAMCDRFTATFCDSLTDCLIDEFGVTQDTIDTIGKDPTEECQNSLKSITDRCKSDGLYDPTSDLIDLNPSRIAAEECLGELDGMSCNDLFSGSLPPICAGAFVSADDLLGFAGGLLDVACIFSSDIPGC
jgi:hypothetical protein